MRYKINTTPIFFFCCCNAFFRHPRGSGGPVITGVYWIPAFAGMTTSYVATCMRDLTPA